MPEPFTAAAARLSGADQRILTEAADRFDEIAKAAIGRAVGGGTVMLLHTRRGRRPVKMRTKSRIGAAVVFVEGVPRAQWTWIETGTKAHSIPKGRARRGRARFLKAPGYAHPVRGPVRHHGSRGKRSWTQTVETFRREYPEIVTTQVRKALDG